MQLLDLSGHDLTVKHLIFWRTRVKNMINCCALQHLVLANCGINFGKGVGAGHA